MTSTSGSTLEGYARLTSAVVEKQVILLKRYWINTIVGVIGMYLFFAMIFFGGQAAAGGQNIDGTLDGLVVGFFLFLAVVSAYFDVANNVMKEAQWGTLEQLYMSPFGIGRVMAVKTVFNIAWSTVIGLTLLAIMLLTTDRTLSIDLLTIVPLVVVTILPAVGLGYVFAGLSMLYKRIENAQQLLQFAFMLLIAAPAAVDSAVLYVLPIAQGSALLTEAMTEGIRLWQFTPFELGVFVANGFAYLLVGYAIFHLLVGRARKLGVMGHY